MLNLVIFFSRAGNPPNIWTDFGFFSFVLRIPDSSNILKEKKSAKKNIPILVYIRHIFSLEKVLTVSFKFQQITK